MLHVLHSVFISGRHLMFIALSCIMWGLPGCVSDSITWQTAWSWSGCGLTLAFMVCFLVWVDLIQSRNYCRSPERWQPWNKKEINAGVVLKCWITLIMLFVMQFGCNHLATVLCSCTVNSCKSVFLCLQVGSLRSAAPVSSPLPSSLCSHQYGQRGWWWPHYRGGMSVGRRYLNSSCKHTWFILFLCVTDL